MSVEEARAALEEAQQEFDNAKGKGVSVVTAASRKLSAAKRALKAAERAEAAGVDVSGLTRTEQLSTIRQAEYAAAQGEAGRDEKPAVPPADAEYTYDYVWRPEVGGRAGYWSLVRYPRAGSANVSTDGTSGTGFKTSDGVLYFNGSAFTGSYNGQIYENGKIKSSASDSSTVPAGFITGPFPAGLEKLFGSSAGYTGYRIVNNADGSKSLEVSTSANSFQKFGASFTVDSNGNYVPFRGTSGSGVSGSTTGSGSTGASGSGSTAGASGSGSTTGATTTDKAKADRQSAFDILFEEFSAMGLASLVEPLRVLIQKDVSPAQFSVELRASEAYQNRFIANKAREKKGLRVLSPGEYLRVEDAYRQTLRAYGLKQFDNDQYVQQFIENDISSAELSDRVAMAVQRVQNADPAISRTLRDYYGIGQADLVAYVLDPNQQAQKIQRQIAAAEIGTAARRQGLEPGVGVSEQLAAQGISEAEAQRGYATIANILPTAEKLSQIYGATMEGYDMAQAEQEVFNQLASAQRRRERLTQREIAQFSGQSGLGRTSLASENRGQF